MQDFAVLSYAKLTRSWLWNSGMEMRSDIFDLPLQGRMTLQAICDFVIVWEQQLRRQFAGVHSVYKFALSIV